MLRGFAVVQDSKLSLQQPKVRGLPPGARHSADHSPPRVHPLCHLNVCP